jgi:hypothetical protein
MSQVVVLPDETQFMSSSTEPTTPQLVSNDSTTTTTMPTVDDILASSYKLFNKNLTTLMKYSSSTQLLDINMAITTTTNPNPPPPPTEAQYETTRATDLNIKDLFAAASLSTPQKMAPLNTATVNNEAKTTKSTSKSTYSSSSSNSSSCSSHSSSSSTGGSAGGGGGGATSHRANETFTANLRRNSNFLGNRKEKKKRKKFNLKRADAEMRHFCASKAENFCCENIFFVSHNK